MPAVHDPPKLDEKNLTKKIDRVRREIGWNIFHQSKIDWIEPVLFLNDELIKFDRVWRALDIYWTINPIEFMFLGWTQKRSVRSSYTMTGVMQFDCLLYCHVGLDSEVSLRPRKRQHGLDTEGSGNPHMPLLMVFEGSTAVSNIGIVVAVSFSMPPWLLP